MLIAHFFFYNSQKVNLIFLKGWRIMYPNGEIDPWHALGVLSSPNDGQPILWVPGASHHFWTHPSLPTDSAEVVSARNTIWKQVTTWLQE